MRALSAIILTFIGCLFVFSTTAYLSCNKPKPDEKDPCENVECLNGSECEDGICACPRGFKGPSCEFRWVTKYLGTWIMLDSSEDGTNASFVYIRPSETEPAAIVIDSFWVYKANFIVADLLSENTVEFKAEQNVHPGYHENYILKSGTAIMDSATGMAGTFVISHQGEPDKLHSFSINR